MWPYTRSRMADKVDKPKKAKAKPKKDDQGVLAALPATRAERIGTRRGSAPKTFEVPAAAQAAAEAVPPKRAAKKAVKSAASGAAKPETGAAAKRRKAVAPRTFETTQAAADAAGDSASPSADPPPRATREPAAASGRPGGLALVSGAVQAVGGLTQAGLKVGGRVVKRAVDRLPKP